MVNESLSQTAPMRRVTSTCRRFELGILWKCSPASRLRSLRSPLARP